MKKHIGASVAMMLVVALPALMLTGLAPTSALSASARQQAQTAAAHKAFVKFMSSHAPMMRASGKAATLSAGPGVTQIGSLNWSGFVESPTTTPTVNAVSGSWTIPQVSCIFGQYRNQDLFLADWVGLDGAFDSTVEQLGTAMQCYEGVEYYYDWYEMFPGGTVEEGTTACINNNVDCPNPGDRIQASVTSTLSGGNNDYTLALTDSSNPSESFSVTAACPATTCLNSSAEWIVERPAFSTPAGFQILPQGDYGQTAFSNATVPSGHGAPPSWNNGNGNNNNGSSSNNGSSNNSGSNGNNSLTTYDVVMVDDSDSYILSCPGQFGPPGQLLVIPAAGSTGPNPCPPVSLNHGFFSDTWDASF